MRCACVRRKLTSADRLFHDHLATQQARIHEQEQHSWQDSWIEQLVPAAERNAPVVTVHDAHPHTLSFIGGALAMQTMSLGVTEFGQSGSQEDLYRHYGIAPENIVQAARSMLKG